MGGQTRTAGGGPKKGWTKKEGKGWTKKEGKSRPKQQEAGGGPKMKGWLLNKILKDPLEHNLLFQRGQLEI